MQYTWNVLIVLDLISLCMCVCSFARLGLLPFWAALPTHPAHHPRTSSKEQPTLGASQPRRERVFWRGQGYPLFYSMLGLMDFACVLLFYSKLIQQASKCVGEYVSANHSIHDLVSMT